MSFIELIGFFGVIGREITTKLDSADDLVQYTIAKANVELYEERVAMLQNMINIKTKNIDLMTMMRNKAATTFRLIYAVVWFVLIYQLVLLVALYYKRLLTVAMLIIVFPLIIAFYAFEKFNGIEQPQGLKTWVMEFLVNVFIQSVHALVYLILIETGVSLYEENPDNWLIFVAAIFAVFPMEAIIKSLLGMKSSTVNELRKSAQRGAAALVAATAIAGARGKYKDIKNKAENKEDKVSKRQKRQDERRENRRNRRDIKAIRNSANSTEANDIITKNRKKDREEDKRRAEKRDAAKKRRLRLRRARYAAQALRNFNARVGAITTGIAGGGDVQDFAAGAAASGFLAGKGRKVSEAKKKEKSSAAARSQGRSSRTRQSANNNGAQTNQPNTAFGAENTAYGNGRTTPTASEANRGRMVDTESGTRTTNNTADGAAAAAFREAFNGTNQNIIEIDTDRN